MATIQEMAAGIIADARLQAERIDAQAAEEVRRIKLQTEELADAARRRLEHEATQQRKDLLAKAEARRQLAARQAILSCKQQLIDETVSAAQKSIAALPAAQRRALITRLLERARQHMTIGTIKASKQDCKFIKGFRVVPLQSSGGFIAVSKDGRVSIDMRFETLLDHVKSVKTAEIANILFAKTKEKDERSPSAKRKLKKKTEKEPRKEQKKRSNPVQRRIPKRKKPRRK